MTYLINKKIGEKFRKSFRPKKHKELSYIMYHFFKIHGEGLKQINLQSRNNNLIAWLIAKFSKGLTHNITVLYAEKLENWFSKTDWEKIKQKWNYYYGNSKPLDESIKVLVLASADDNGMNVFDFSAYQKRQLSIRQVGLPISKQRKVARWLVSKLDAEYDYTGLVFFYLYRFIKWLGFLNDPKSFLCSEENYDAFKNEGYLIADIKNPSPADIEEYAPERIIYSNLTIKI